MSKRVIDLDLLMFTARERLMPNTEIPEEEEHARWQELKRFIQTIIQN